MSTPVSPYASNPPARHSQGTVTLFSPFDKDGAVLSANQDIVVSGRAPMAARLTIRILGSGTGHVSELFFINGKGTLAERNFTVTLPGLPAGGPYYLVVTGVDGDVKYYKVFGIQVK